MTPYAVPWTASGTPMSAPTGPAQPSQGPPVTHCPPTLIGPVATCTWTTGQRSSQRRRTRFGKSSKGSAEPLGGTPGSWPGGYVASSTGSGADQDCDEAGVARTTCRSATSWTGGGSRRSWTANCSGSEPRCGSRVGPGSTWASRSTIGTDGVPAAGGLCPPWTVGPRVLVGGVAVPRIRFRRDAAQHRRKRGAGRPRGQRPEVEALRRPALGLTVTCPCGTGSGVRVSVGPGRPRARSARSRFGRRRPPGSSRSRTSCPSPRPSAAPR